VVAKKEKKRPQVTSSHPLRMGRHATKTPTNPNFDGDLYEWVVLMRSRGLPVNYRILKARAEQIQQMYPGLNMKFTRNWALCFRKRHKLTPRRRSTTQVPDKEIETKRAAFQKEIRSACLDAAGRLCVHPNLIINMDETAVFYDTIQSTVYDSIGRKRIGIRSTGSEKCRVTAMVAGHAGNRFLRIGLIFKLASSGVRVSRDVETWLESQNPRPAEVWFNQKGWVNEDRMLAWIEVILLAHIRETMTSMKLPPTPGQMYPRTVLMMDHCSAHEVDSVASRLRQLNVQLIFVPWTSQ